jgi:hypothetical protein
MHCLERESTIFIVLIFAFLLLAKDNERSTLSKKEPLTREKTLVVSLKYSNGYITVGKSESQYVYEGEFTYSDYRPDIRYDIVGDEGRLDVYFSGEMRESEEDRGSGDIHSLNELYKNDLTLRLTNKAVLDLDFDLGVVKGEVDLSGLNISNLDLEMGVSKTTVRFSEVNQTAMKSFDIEGGVGKLTIENLGNANISEFFFEGGVGSYELNFAGEYQQSLQGEISLGMGKIVLYLPRYIGTRLSVDKSLLSSLEVDEVFKNGDVYTNDKWEKTKYNLDLNIETGLGKIEVIWVE